jgi:hypothetical protein
MTTYVGDFLVACVLVFLVWGAAAGLVLLFTALAKRVRRPAPTPPAPATHNGRCEIASGCPKPAAAVYDAYTPDGLLYVCATHAPRADKWAHRRTA